MLSSKLSLLILFIFLEAANMHSLCILITTFIPSQVSDGVEHQEVTAPPLRLSCLEIMKSFYIGNTNKDKS